MRLWVLFLLNKTYVVGSHLNHQSKIILICTHNLHVCFCAKLKTVQTKTQDIQTYMYIALDKKGYLHNTFLISPQKDTLWYSLEVPRQGISNEYPQHMFLWRNMKTISIL